MAFFSSLWLVAGLYVPRPRRLSSYKVRMRLGSNGLKPMVWHSTLFSAHARPRSLKVFWSSCLVRPSPMSTNIFWWPTSTFLSRLSPSCTASGICTVRASGYTVRRLSSAAIFLGALRGMLLFTTSVKPTRPAMARVSRLASSLAPPAVTSARASPMEGESCTTSTTLSNPLASALP